MLEPKKIAFGDNGTDPLDIAIRFSCPVCYKSEKLQIPQKIFDDESSIVTVSIPKGVVCDHYFQAYIDKNFKVRGAQKVDFEFSKVEYFGEIASESSSCNIETDGTEITEIKTSPLFQEVIGAIREFVDHHSETEEVLGAALLRENGHLLYSSLPSDILWGIIREFETRSEKDLVPIKRLFLQLESDQIICSEVVGILDTNFNAVLIFSEDVKFGMANYYLTDLIAQLEEIS